MFQPAASATGSAVENPTIPSLTLRAGGVSCGLEGFETPGEAGNSRLFVVFAVESG